MAQASQALSLGQFVRQLAALLQKKDVKLPFKNQEPWHLLFYELKTQSGTRGKPKFLDELVFDWDSPYPKCQQLSEFLNALHFTASASVRNPHYDVISVDRDLADRWAHIANSDDADLKSFVTHAVDLAEKEFGTVLSQERPD